MEAMHAHFTAHVYRRHAAGHGGFTCRVVHIWPEFFAGLTGTGRGLPLFGSPVPEDPPRPGRCAGCWAKECQPRPPRPGPGSPARRT